jgi:hypothetical protein
LVPHLTPLDGQPDSMHRCCFLEGNKPEPPKQFDKLEFDELIGDDNDVVIQKEKQGYCSIADTYTFTSNYASYW